jgi:two-component system nitrogen regulation response regulator NtrX
VAAVTLMIPPLRERREEIEPLVQAFLARAGSKLTLSSAALQRLQEYAWPGNVRELRNLVERVLIMTDAEPIEARDLPAEVRVQPAEISSRGLELATLSDFKEFAEREFLVARLRENGWNISRTAEVIQTPRSNLYKKIEHHKISRDQDS